MDSGLNTHHHFHVTEEDYIDMDLTSSTNFLPCSHNSTEFEFKMTSNSVDMQHLTSPADELFYNGKLLPLQQSSCKEMADKFLKCPSTINNSSKALSVLESFNYSTPATPYYASYELNPDDNYFYDCSQPRKHSSWSRRLKFIKQSSIGSRLKASKAYLKSIFRKNGNSADKVSVECSDSMMRKAELKDSDATDTSVNGVCEEKLEGELSVHRRSFSGAIKWQLYSPKSSSFSLSSSSSSSSSFSSMSIDDHCGQPVLKRSSSVNSDIESSVQGAIAYCKKSQLERV